MELYNIKTTNMKIYRYNTDEFTPAEIESFKPFCEKQTKNKVYKVLQLHYFLKQLLSKHYGICINDIRLNYTSKGKPFYKDDLKFSITHTGSIVLIALNDKEIGIDAEIIRPINKSILKKTATEEEITMLEASHEFNTNFLKMWTVKEAYFKCTGTGITHPAGISVQKICRKYNVNTELRDNCVISSVSNK